MSTTPEQFNAWWRQETSSAGIPSISVDYQRLALRSWCAGASAERKAAEARRIPLGYDRLQRLARDAHIAFCMNKADSFEEAFARAVEHAHGIRGPQ